MYDELTIEYASNTLAQYRAAYEADYHHLRAVGGLRPYATDHASTPPFLAPLNETD